MPVGSVTLPNSGKMLARRRGTPLRQGKQSVWTPVFNGIAVENLVHKRIFYWGRSPNPHFYNRMEMIII